MSEEPENVQVDLVDATPEPPPMEPPPPEPTPVEPPPTPLPAPVPIPEPALVPEKPAEPKPVEKPEEPKPAPKPRNEAHLPKTTVATAHSSQRATAGVGTSAKPRYRSNPAPEYPAEARRLKQQGVVVLAVVVSAQGRPTSVKLSRSSGFAALDKAALDAVSRWSFEPAQTAGIPVASHVDVPVRFSLAR